MHLQLEVRCGPEVWTYCTIEWALTKAFPCFLSFYDYFFAEILDLRNFTEMVKKNVDCPNQCLSFWCQEKKCTKLVKFWDKIGKPPWLITVFLDFWPFFHFPWLFNDDIKLPQDFQSTIRERVPLPVFRVPCSHLILSMCMFGRLFVVVVFTTFSSHQ